MKKLMVLFVFLFIGANVGNGAQVVRYLNCERLTSLNVSENNVNFTLQCYSSDEDETYNVTGSVNDGLTSYHFGEFLGLRTLRISNEVIDILRNAAE